LSFPATRLAIRSRPSYTTHACRKFMAESAGAGRGRSAVSGLARLSGKRFATRR